MRNLIVLMGFSVLMGSAVAQGGSPIEVDLDAETIILLAPISDDDGADTQSVLGEISLNAKAEKILDSGTRIRARTSLRVQNDHPERRGATGGFGAIASAPVGAFSGLSAGPVRDQSDVRVRFETAYLQVDGGYGELRIGKDRGVAARFHEGPKSSLSHARLDSTLLDPSGLSTIRTRHDLTGPSLKVSYASPRLLGLRAGVSFTPDANADGLDRRPAAGTGGGAPDTRNAVEMALNGTRKLRDSGLRVDAALAWSTAEVTDRAGLAPYARIETVSAGTRVEKDEWTLGASWLSSDNGLADSDYSAWSVGAARPLYGIDWALNYGEAEDKGAQIDSSSWRFGGAYDIADNTSIGVAYTRDSVENSFKTQQAQAIVVEITLSAEILKITGN